MTEHERPNEADNARRQAADELAALLAKPDGLRLLRWYQSMQKTPEPSPTESAEPTADDSTQESDSDPSPRPIGIWHPQPDSGRTVWVRAFESAGAADAWAPQMRLEPKRSILPLRVCLLGESTAAGMFYRPEVTPARVLEQQLRLLKGPGMCEVLDLTKISIGIVELIELAVSATQLAPDIMVVFAGNNWAQRILPEAALETQQHNAGILATQGVRGLLDHCAAGLRDQARRLLEDLAAIAEMREIPVIVVVPEVNLLDWSRRRPVTWLPGGATSRWHQLMASAIASLDLGDPGTAARVAGDMLALDHGTCATTFRLLARARQLEGRLDEARDAGRREVDASSWDGFFVGVPQTASATREELMRGAREHGLPCIDLASVFDQYSGSTDSDQRLFLDYCHLSLPGIKLAMAAVSAQILTAIGGEDVVPSALELAERLPDPEVSDRVHATAQFMAGLHTAHVDLPVERHSAGVTYWFERAAGAWSGMAAMMEDFLLARSAACPDVLTAPYRRIQESGAPLDIHVWSWPNIDAEVTDAILEVLERCGQSRARVEERLAATARPRPGRIDLTHPYHLERPVEAFCRNMQIEALFTDRSVHRAPAPVSTFCLRFDGLSDLPLEATVRLPSFAGSRQGQVLVTVNGTTVGEFESAERWTRWRVTVDRKHLKRGINRVSLRWPALPPHGDQALEHARQRLMQGLTPDLFPVFGEVFSLLAG